MIWIDTWKLADSVELSAKTRAAGDISIASGVSPWSWNANDVKPPQGGDTNEFNSRMYGRTDSCEAMFAS